MPSGSARLAIRPYGSFRITQEVTVPVEPARAFALFTDNVAEWWDHCFSGQPSNLSMDAQPGGLFYERFGEGEGVIHAEFTLVERGKRLVMRGPLGFHGHALDLVCTVEFEATEDGGTRVSAKAVGAGELEEGWSDAVDRVWQHFLAGRFQPYVERLTQ